jgi:hypothetical protein
LTSRAKKISLTRCALFVDFLSSAGAENPCGLRPVVHVGRFSGNDEEIKKEAKESEL